MRAGISGKIAALTGVLALWTGAAAPAQQAGEIIQQLPSGAVTIQSCNWSVRHGAFVANFKLRDHTNLPVAKTRILVTFVNAYGETAQGYVDMTDNSVEFAPGMKMTGKWSHGTFPDDLRSVSCTLTGVKFTGYPNVIYSALEQKQ